MDARLRFAAKALTGGKLSACPPEAPLAMPAQPISLPRVKPAPELDGRWRLGVIVLGAALITGLAAYEMYNTLNVSGMTPLEWAVLVLFCLNFAWISSASATAFAGFFNLLGARGASPAPPGKLTTRTAIIMPMYNEQPARVLGGAEAVWDALVAAGAAEHFEIFLLSDTTDPTIALAEEAAFRTIRASRPDAPFFYRRRTLNRHRKSGNVHDFVERWGGRYDFMVVFDADSLMSPAALIELARRMETRPSFNCSSPMSAAWRRGRAPPSFKPFRSSSTPGRYLRAPNNLRCAPMDRSSAAVLPGGRAGREISGATTQLSGQPRSPPMRVSLAYQANHRSVAPC